jgi:peptidoglycan/xylan/chitin deacetylase (PgdA/CDA1 family)
MILAYHKISDRIDLGIGSVRPERLREQVQFLLEKNWLEKNPSPEAWHNEKAVLSFDDAYENAFTEAFPILQAVGAAACIFPATKFIGQHNAWDATPFGAFHHATAGQLRTLADAGWLIGSHGHTHTALVQLSDAQLKTELVTSRNILEDIIDKPVQTLNFPFGNFNARVLDAVHRAGYTATISISGETADGFVTRSKAVYRTDTVRNIEAKVRDLTVENCKLKTVNSFAQLMLVLHWLKTLNRQSA